MFFRLNKDQPPTTKFRSGLKSRIVVLQNSTLFHSICSQTSQTRCSPWDPESMCTKKDGSLATRCSRVADVVIQFWCLRQRNSSSFWRLSFYTLSYVSNIGIADNVWSCTAVQCIISAFDCFFLQMILMKSYKLILCDYSQWQQMGNPSFIWETKVKLKRSLGSL